MSRIRTIKPEFWISEQVMDCSHSARLLFIGMWNFCDDGGVHSANTRKLKAEVFPGDDVTLVDVDGWIKELIKQRLVVEYAAQYDGESRDFWFITGWKHQRIDKPYLKYPPYEGYERSATDPQPFDDHSKNVPGTVDDHVQNSPGTVDDHSKIVPGTVDDHSSQGVDRSGEEGKGEEGSAAAPARRTPAPRRSPPRCRRGPTNTVTAAWNATWNPSRTRPPPGATNTPTGKPPYATPSATIGPACEGPSARHPPAPRRPPTHKPPSSPVC